MANQFTALGFDDPTDSGCGNILRAAERNANVRVVLSGPYTVCRILPNIEVWMQQDAHETEALAAPESVRKCVPSFNGDGRIMFGIADLVPEPGNPLSGVVYGWVNPAGRPPDRGDYPVTVEIPDFDAFRGQVGVNIAVQLRVTAFANRIQAFNTVAEFRDAQRNSRVVLEAESYIPYGVLKFTGDIKQTDPTAVFSGRVHHSAMLTNGLTGRPFYYLFVSTFGGTYDVVVDPRLLGSLPKVGEIVLGQYRLTGRLAS